jgi:hypothetical protein
MESDRMKRLAKRAQIAGATFANPCIDVRDIADAQRPLPLSIGFYANGLALG